MISVMKLGLTRRSLGGRLVSKLILMSPSVQGYTLRRGSERCDGRPLGRGGRRSHLPPVGSACLARGTTGRCPGCALSTRRLAHQHCGGAPLPRDAPPPPP